MKLPTVRDLGEFGLIHRLQRLVGAASPPRPVPIMGIGDDCAVLPGPTGKHLLLTCDPVVENIHYRPATPPRRVGWKAMARNLSDIAAMSGRPRWAVVSLGLRPNTPVRYVTELYRGLHTAARQFGCVIVGGDTTRVAHEQFVVVTLLGEVERRRLVLRRGARPGDAVLVTGTLGGSRGGKHLTFTPRLREARWLTAHYRLHAMIDVSDGLASDLQRLVEAGGTGFNISSRQIPISPAARRTPNAFVVAVRPDRHVSLTTRQTFGRPAGAGGGVRRPSHNWALSHALTDGEDFELLFTVSPRDARRLKQRWPFRLPLTEIGTAIKPRAVLLDGGPLTAHGYDHFQPR